MSQAPPFRQRPNLHLALAHTSGSPRPSIAGTPTRTPFATTPASTPGGTPFGITNYSPLRSASLKAPTPQSGISSSPPLRRQNSRYGINWHRRTRRMSIRSMLLFFIALTLTIWWFNGGRQELDEVKLSAAGLSKGLLTERRMHNYQFYPATNPKIHYMGRWMPTPNHLRKDGTFPGVYFDVVVRNTTSFFVALHNRPAKYPSSSVPQYAARETVSTNRPANYLSFRPLPANQEPASPVSLVARIDDAEYVILPNSSALVAVCLDSLNQQHEHQIRIIAPMIDDGGSGVVELEGLWLSKGGLLDKVWGSMLDEDYVDEDMLRAENDLIGEKHRAGLNELEKDGTNRFNHLHHNYESESDLFAANRDRKKVLEVVTDSPGSFIPSATGKHAGATDRLLAGLMGWEYLLGEMFGVDHVGIGVDGMCLIQDCIGGTGFPAGVGDVFFRSGAYGSEYFEHSWMFSGYIPDVLIINIGESDNISFEEHHTEYNRTMPQLTDVFENTYVSFVQGVRRLGYSKHPAIVLSERLGFPGVIPHNVPASVPIFIMRPLTGQLEHATQNVVNKLRAGGDRSVFWLDTSGWLDPEVIPEGPGDFYLDESSTPSRMRLTQQGNQRVAIFLHVHVCHYLATLDEECPFLPQEVYQGTAYDREEANFDQYLETQKEERLRELFWGSKNEEVGEQMPATELRSQS